MSILNWSTPSGSIGTVVEGSTFSFFFAFDMVPYGNLVLVSGELPEGLVFDPIQASISGNVGIVDELTIYPFTLRIQNESGIKDRSFFLTVTNNTPTWITPEELVQDNGQNYRTNMLIDKQLEIFNPSPSEQKFELISSNLPEELTFLEDGRLVGFVSNSSGSYNFTAKVQNISKTFHITVLDDSANRPPFWSTINGYIGDAISGTEFVFNFTGADANNDLLTITLHEDDVLPNGLFLSGNTITGNISPDEVGNKFFRMEISDGIEVITRTFFIRANIKTDSDVEFGIAVSPFLTNDGNNNLLQDEASYFKVSATQQFGEWIRYELVSGSLPNGLLLNISNGDIEGKSTEIGTYSFTIKAFNNIEFETFQTFVININSRQDYFPNKVSSIVTGYDRSRLNDLYISNKIPYEMIYRAGDKNFGTTLLNEIGIHRYVTATKNDIYDVVKNRIGSEAIPIKFKHVPVQNSIGQVICECVLLVFEDKVRNGLETFVSNGDIIKITSLDLFREQLSDLSMVPFLSFYNWQSEYYTPIIENDTFLVRNHDFYTGKIVSFKNQDVPSPFLNDTIYYAIVVDENSIRLANSKSEALSNSYIQFNVNEVSRNGVLYAPHTAIPFVYCNTGFGERVANSLNDLSLDGIKLYFKHFIYGPTSTYNQEDLELVWFEEKRI